jgi:uncharacterized repeat protein (TIGR01451 family)
MSDEFSLRSVLALPTRLDRNRLLGALFVTGLLGGVAFLLVASMTPLYGVGDPLYLVALAFPTVGVVLGLAALVAFLRSSSDTAESMAFATPAATETESADAVGDSFARVLDQAERGRYSGRATSGAEQIHDLLVGAVRQRLRRHQGLNSTSAGETLEDGSWTDDPVAAGFLSPERRLPLVERLRGAVDPGGAYRRRLDRTLDAIDRLERDDRGEAEPDDADDSDTENDRTATVFEGPLPQEDRKQRTTTVGVLLAWLLVGVGLATGGTILVVGATVGLVYVAAGAIASSPGGSVELTRHVSQVSGDPGDRVTVETTVHNTGETPLVDLSVVDGVPEQLPVSSGSPRACLSLAPGESAAVSYELELRRGEFAFDPVAVRTSDLTGLVTEQHELGPESGQELRCLPAVGQIPLGNATNDYAGTVPTDEGGSGVEFYSVREYEAGDPVGAIDWRRYAHTRDLATVEYRAERSTRVVCVVDCRESQQQAAAETQLPARDISVAAARRSVDTLVRTGHPTGLITVEEDRLWQVEPGTSSETRAAVGALLEAQRDGHEPESEQIRSLTGRPTGTLPGLLPGEAQVFLFSSLVDDVPVDLVARLRSQGFAVTVISPDVTAGAAETAVRLAGLERDERVVRARGSGAGVIDWDVGRPLAGVLDEAIQGVAQP